MHHRRFVAPLLAALLFACSGSPSPDAGTGGGGGGGAGGGAGGGVGGGDSGTALSAQSVCADLYAILCRRDVECGRLEALHRARCEAQWLSCDRGLGQMSRSGALSLDPTAAQRCADAARTAPCAILDDQVDVECDLKKLFRPARQLGGSCTSHDHCAGGFCAGSSSSCGACTAYRTAGQPCASGELCDPATLYCGPTDAGIQCQARRADGAPCVDPRECASGKCPPPSDGGSLSTCGPLPNGAPCQGSDDCGATSYCPTPTTAPTTCAPRIATGQGCVSDRGDQGCADSEAVCLDGVCKIVPALSRAQGQQCRRSFQCAAGLYCKGASSSLDGVGSCAPHEPPSGSCAGLDQDACGLVNVCFNGLCAAPLPTGSACTPGDPCTRLTECEQADAGFTCRPRPFSGERCRYTTECLDGYCSPDAGICLAAKPNGAECSFSGAECQSGRCRADGGSSTCQSGCL